MSKDMPFSPQKTVPKGVSRCIKMYQEVSRGIKRYQTVSSVSRDVKSIKDIKSIEKVDCTDGYRHVWDMLEKCKDMLDRKSLVFVGFGLVRLVLVLF